MSKPDIFTAQLRLDRVGAWVVFIAGCVVVVISVISLIVSPGVIAVVALAVGVALVLSAVGYSRRHIARMRVADPEVVVPDRSLRVGEEFSVSYRQELKRATEVSRMRFELVLRETARYTTTDENGTHTGTKRHDEVAQVFAVAGQRFEPGQTINENCTFRIPANGMHTFTGNNNRIEWYVVACVEMHRWPDYRWEHELTVLPKLLG
jgi:hypothetical protein